MTAVLNQQNTSSKMINISGDTNDANYAYKMPCLQTKIEGRGGGIKTILTNIVDIARHLNTAPSYITKYCGITVGALSKYDFKRNVGIVYGKHQTEELQRLLSKYINEFILCPKCKLPELIFKIHQKKNLLLQKCVSCNYKGANISTHNVKRYIISHPVSLWREKYYKYEHAFLRGCVNFNSAKHNFKLLLLGYIRNGSYNDVHIYEYIPMDIISLIFFTCYAYKKLETKKDKWSSRISNNAWIQSNGAIKWSSLLCDIALTKQIIDYKLKRKVWRIKIICISEGLTIEMTEQYKNTSNALFKYELIDSKNDKINNGDYIKILMINYESNTLIRVAIKNKCLQKKYETKNMNLRETKYRLTFRLSQGDEIRLIQ